METRRKVFLSLGIALLALHSATRAQTKAAPTESSLRVAVAAYVETWNKHDVQAWSAALTDDIWYTEATDYYQRMKGREAVLAFFGDLVKTSDLKWEVDRIKMMPDGTATIVLRHFALILPKSDNKYASSFENSPSVARWRIEGDRWRMFFFTSHKGTAIDAMKKDGLE